MPRFTTGISHIMERSAAILPPGHPIREACRLELARLRDECATQAELATALGCSARTLRRLLRMHAVKRFDSPFLNVKYKPAGHPPQRWCSCEWCVAARGAA